MAAAGSIEFVIGAIISARLKAELPGAIAEALDARPGDVNRLLNRQEMAERLGVSERTLDTLRGEGMPTVWVLESPRFEFAAVVDWLKSRPAKGRAA